MQITFSIRYVEIPIICMKNKINYFIICSLLIYRNRKFSMTDEERIYIIRQTIIYQIKKNYCNYIYYCGCNTVCSPQANLWRLSIHTHTHAHKQIYAYTVQGRPDTLYLVKSLLYVCNPLTGVPPYYLKTGGRSLCMLCRASCMYATPYSLKQPADHSVRCEEPPACMQNLIP